jgi:hypothetical protein
MARTSSVSSGAAKERLAAARRVKKIGCIAATILAGRTMMKQKGGVKTLVWEDLPSYIVCGVKSNSIGTFVGLAFAQKNGVTCNEMS